MRRRKRLHHGVSSTSYPMDAEEEIVSKIREVISRAKKANCLHLLQIPEDSIWKRWMRAKFYILPILFAAVLAYLGPSLFPSTSDKCLVEMPDWIVKATRPPEDCSFCSNVTKVDTVSDLSPQTFREKYAYSGVPVVVADGMKNWTAPEVFSFEYFASIYTDEVLSRRDSARCQFFPYETGFRSLWEVFEMSEDRAALRDNPWYVGWSNCDEEIGDELRSHYTTPYFFPTDSESKQTDWIFMGSPGYGAPMHVDNVRYSSWQGQITGSKEWTLEPPPECYFSCNTIKIVVHPGEIIVVDTNRWYHKTLIVSKGISITIGAEYD